MHPGVVFQRAGRAQQRHDAIKAAAGLKKSRRSERHAAPSFARFDSGQIQRSPLSGHGGGGWLIVHLDAAHANPAAHRVNFQLRFRTDLAGDQGASHHGTEPLHHKGAIDGQTSR